MPSKIRFAGEIGASFGVYTLMIGYYWMCISFGLFIVIGLGVDYGNPNLPWPCVMLNDLVVEICLPASTICFLAGFAIMLLASTLLKITRGRR